MLIKVVSLFLIAMLVLGMFGKLRLPKRPRFKRRDKIGTASKCPRCGAFNPGKGPCPCGHDA